ncbi:6-phosphofructokinase [Egicoccus halophilus]|uniref:6-phosphofructokinase n=1 Tax=Egicoccus halophilus TaxID=1670830 RepID=A0A8J3AAY9_9ACTN|nr:6-phosphofructokinase [Egicoccus halophilus]GGI09632.1 6-phosphofructokinase [Egicoccus halophilus]
MNRPDSIGVLTSGGDAPGMNAAVRAVVRTALAEGVDVYAIYEGFRGMVEGGDAIRPMGSHDVGGILHRGGTVIGTARSDRFRTRDGRRQAAANLLAHGIDALVVIGGDGSLTGANLFRSEWPELLEELVEAGELDADVAAAHPHLRLTGMVGSIDNDMFGTDMTIGADTALHRITEAIDAIHATAASHQRSFVVEVMGRNCGYLALMSALATGANWAFIPENPPQIDDWEASLQSMVRAGRRIGRRSNLVVVAEGARDLHGEPITADRVQKILEEGLGEDTRVTILGHVQRGGATSAFDRNLSTQCGYHAVQELLRLGPDEEPKLIGIRRNRITSSPLMEAVERTHAVADHLQRQEYDEAMLLRGGSFAESFETLRTLVRAQPSPPIDSEPSLRLAVLHAGGPAPGMNTAARAAVRVGLDRGHTMLGVQRGFKGLRDGDVAQLDWMSVSGWVSRGGAELGTSRLVLGADELAAIARTVEEQRIDGLLMIGGLSGYEAAHALLTARDEHPALDLPIVCLPATINNDVPGTELSIGVDTALNSIVSDVDKIKQSAVASRRCFVVEVMGKSSGYLALTSGMATGAERIYTPEEGITLDALQDHVRGLTESFRNGQSLGLVIRAEEADEVYTTPFLWALFEKEGGNLFDVRQAILGHVQTGGNPSPFDRIQATRLAVRGVDYLVEAAVDRGLASAVGGLVAGKVAFTPLQEVPALLREREERPTDVPWFSLRPIADVMARPAPPPTA